MNKTILNSEKCYEKKENKMRLQNMLMGREEFDEEGQVRPLRGGDTWAETWKDSDTQKSSPEHLLIAKTTSSARTLQPEPASCERGQEIRPLWLEQSLRERTGHEAKRRGRARRCRALLARLRCLDFILVAIKSRGRILSREWHDKSILRPGAATTTIIYV